jgi:ElaA protein
MTHEKTFHELTVDELYAILRLRQEVFVVEQTCAYLDCDDHDQRSIHLFTTDDDTVVAYARVLPPGEKFAEASLGRVVTAKSARRTGAGRAIVQRAIEVIERRFGRVPIRISAQSYLARFYGELGFSRDSEEYPEDGIPHLEMRRPATPE